MLFRDLEETGIDVRILDAVQTMNYVTLTPVQEKTIPLVLSRCDLLVQAPTGTGKTAAFAIPIVNSVDTSVKAVQAVVLCPTRELVMQITDEFRKIGFKIPGLQVLSIYGGQNIDRQFSGLRRKPQIIVGTTGRVMDHLNRKTLKLNDAKFIVLDEADEMLDMGFRGDIDFILERMNSEVQTLMFSATMPKEILELSVKYQKSALTVKTTCGGEDIPPIKQYFLPIAENNKYAALTSLISEKDYHNVLVFCNTKRKVTELDERLNADYHLSAALHGDMRQSARDKIMKSFRAHEINMLIATDVAARGIDVDNIEAIFNYDVPLDPEYYVHRIGRTARANKSGTAYTFATTRDRAKFIACEKAAGSNMEEYGMEGITLTPHGADRKKAAGADTVRFFLNVGTRDGVTAKVLTGLLTSETKLEEKDIYDINLRDIYGFVEVAADKADEVLSLKGERRFRRVLSVEVADAKGGKKATAKPTDRQKDGRAQKPATSGGRAQKPFASESKTKKPVENDGDKRQKDFAEKSEREYGAKPKRSYQSKPEKEYGTRTRTTDKVNTEKEYGAKPGRNNESKPKREYDSRPGKNTGARPDLNANGETGNKRVEKPHRDFDRKPAEKHAPKSNQGKSEKYGKSRFEAKSDNKQKKPVASKSRFYVDSTEDSNPVNEFYKSKEAFNRSRPVSKDNRKKK